MRHSPAVAAIALVLSTVLAGCGSASPPSASLTTSEPASTPTPSPSSPPISTLLDQAGDARQVILVTAGSYGSSTASLTAYERDADGWRSVMGPWTARVGAKGFAPPGEKVEGDGRTPSGAYGFDFFFGVSPDPGVRFAYRQVPDDTIVWDEDPASPTYNLWVDLDDRGGGRDPEGMYRPVAYQHGAVIAYNTARTPGLGSGIFLHVSTGRATAGCVSLPVEQLVTVLRWLDPAHQPRIVMGVASAP